jgi:ATP-dependent Clp protease adaptor protein ClpS
MRMTASPLRQAGERAVTDPDAAANRAQAYVRGTLNTEAKANCGSEGAFPDGHRPNIMMAETRRNVRTEMSGIEKRGDEGPTTGTVVKAKPKTKKPSMYKVLMLNDDYTPMEFVVHILERFFSKTRDEATRIMLHVHRRGVGICGVFTYEVAESKVTQVMDFARQHQHPLQCTLEKE